jgi:RNA polymerase sigma-70 factor, ECF subfamily
MSSERGAVPEPARDDRELVKRMLAGEEHAFGEFFDGHFPRLYRFSLPRLGQDADAAEEVVQAALCKAISALKSWRGEAPLFTWLCTFCRHEISGHYRRHQSQPQAVGLIEDSPDGGAGLDSLAAQLDRGPDDEVRRGEIARLVHSTLDRLPGRYGEALEWKYIHGFSVGEIAARMKVGPKAVESLLTRARHAFREAFATPEGSDR